MNKMPYSEQDTKAKIIEPKLESCKWEEDLLIREYPISADRFVVEGDTYRKLDTKLFADYVLYWANTVISVVEAKAEDEKPMKYLSQAQDYAKRLDIPLAYITNGQEIILHDRRTGETKEVEEYLEPVKMYQIYQEWKGLTSLEYTAYDALHYPLYISGYRKPRAYQEAAIKNAVENICKGNKKSLLTMATGTGKTFIAFQIAWKLIKSKHMGRVLFLTDRIILRDQAYNDFEPFREGSTDPRYKLENGNFNHNHNIYFSTYQTLFAEDLYKKIPTDFFDLIVIDECHRSRYGDWGEILDYFSNAYHLGMTATPKREDNIDVYEFFGKPVYEYSLGQAIEDGYLVPYKIYKITTNLYQLGLDTTLAEEVIYDTDIDTEDVKDYYDPSEFEKMVTIPDQITVMSQKVIDLLNKTGEFGKTIIFCVDMEHAQKVKDKINELKGKEDYATRIVAEDKDDLTVFRDKERPTPVVATTVDLLSTGVDIPHLRNIVFMKPVSSVVLFKQIIGRGSRLFEGKGFFRIVDFTNATRLLDQWDVPEGGDGPGEPVIPEQPFDKYIYGYVAEVNKNEGLPNVNVFASVGEQWKKETNTDSDGKFEFSQVPSNEDVRISFTKEGYRAVTKYVSPFVDKEQEPVLIEMKIKKPVPHVRVEGVEVTVGEEIEIEYNGSSISYAEYKAKTKEGILDKIHTTDELKAIWTDEQQRKQLLEALGDKKLYIELIRNVENLGDVDGFDVIAHIAFNAPLISREERVKNFIRDNEKSLGLYSENIRKNTMEFLDRYKYHGEDNISTAVFTLPNMYTKKQEIQSEFTGGLNGFISFVRNSIYGNMGSIMGYQSKMMETTV